MKTELQKNRWAAYWGAAAGLIIFALVGLLPSSFVGGVLGLKAAGFLFGGTAEAGLASRALVGASMIVGVMVTGLIFVTGSAAMAWAAAQIAAVLRRRIVQEHA